MPFLPSTLPKVCIALGFASATELKSAAEAEYKDGNTFLEFRLDYLAEVESGIAVLEELCDRYSDLQILATCRSHLYGGNFAGTVMEQIAILHRAVDAGALAVDLEVESAEQAKEALAVLRSRVAVVISFHDFQGTPPMQTAGRRLRKIPADAYKLIVTARKPSDNQRLITWMRDNGSETPTIAFAMSEMGVPTRILAPSFGSAYTYAAPCQAGGTAPGQIPGRLMKSLYRCEKLSRTSRVYGVIADPVAHTKSPVLHNRGFQARRMDAVYVPFRVPQRFLGEWMKLALTIPVHGFSVTIPHKRAIMRYLDTVEPLAKRIGAANTVWRKAGKWRGANTDVDGVIRPLQRRAKLAGAHALVAGYGGGARAAAFGLSDAGASVTITGRNPAQAQALARACRGSVLSLEDAEKQDFDVLVHATPVGMTPHDNETLFPDRVPGNVVLDMVYNPRETLLLSRAKAEGKTVIEGAEMLLEQALRQFEIWTGDSAPRDAMSKALEDSLSSRS